MFVQCKYVFGSDFHSVGGLELYSTYIRIIIFTVFGWTLSVVYIISKHLLPIDKC